MEDPPPASAVDLLGLRRLHLSILHRFPPPPLLSPPWATAVDLCRPLDVSPPPDVAAPALVPSTPRSSPPSPPPISPSPLPPSTAATTTASTCPLDPLVPAQPPPPLRSPPLLSPSSPLSLLRNPTPAPLLTPPQRPSQASPPVMAGPSPLIAPIERLHWCPLPLLTSPPPPTTTPPSPSLGPDLPLPSPYNSAHFLRGRSNCTHRRHPWSLLLFSTRLTVSPTPPLIPHIPQSIDLSPLYSPPPRPLPFPLLPVLRPSIRLNCQ